MGSVLAQVSFSPQFPIVMYVLDTDLTSDGLIVEVSKNFGQPNVQIESL